MFAVSAARTELLGELAHRNLSRACAAYFCVALAHRNLLRALAPAERSLRVGLRLSGGLRVEGRRG